MTKTSTQTNFTEQTTTQSTIIVDHLMNEEQFYENIKSRLNELKKDPSDESVAKILKHAQLK
ncbi:hypothetical protein [Pedobacter montanisoli]|uniref:Uncharacterized protein n=1 Tax=Pedobacter montanisoli TaxID=2923277 RepID=A0ABS9ZWH2_9SPHI|nr:hypothetical protein [Pedobacter montanisoli]MCJ0742650.1 hypothetical protein [Pedobacter montanisoli]